MSKSFLSASNSIQGFVLIPCCAFGGKTAATYTLWSCFALVVRAYIPGDGRSNLCAPPVIPAMLGESFWNYILHKHIVSRSLPAAHCYNGEKKTTSFWFGRKLLTLLSKLTSTTNGLKITVSSSSSTQDLDLP
ncbi:MAG: hypothetical protein IPL23_24280 [Saprospiraceae bacterium]|nr:hypothetical protein [Saprospiraceae bacterium]